MTRQIGLALAVLTCFVVSAFAAEEITDPTADPTELWHYGSAMNNQTVTFRWENGCSAYTIKIEPKDNPGEELFSQAWGAPGANPVSQNIWVPDPLDALEVCKLSVMITHTMGTITTISQDVNIAKP